MDGFGIRCGIETILGTAVIGGMLAASLLAIFLIPVTFDVVELITAKMTGGAKPGNTRPDADPVRCRHDAQTGDCRRRSYCCLTLRPAQSWSELQRPAVATPDQFFNAAPANADAAAETTSLGDEKWFTSSAIRNCRR